MKQLMHEGMIAVREEEPKRELRPPVEQLAGNPVGIGATRSDEPRCSPDPMQRTDRYRLVTPYVNSSRDL